jgi:hypothetical protein
MEDNKYEDAMRQVRNSVEQGLPFDQACSLITVENIEVREMVINNSLRLLIAEMHYKNGMPLKQLAMKLRLSLSRLMNAKESMKEGELTAPACLSSQMTGRPDTI